MKKLFLYSIFIYLFFNNFSISQVPDTGWLTKITHEAGLDSARGGRIWLADINNDNYPDLFWGEGGVNKNHLYCYLNVPNPDKNSSVKRIFIPWTDSSNCRENRDLAKSDRVVDIMSAADVNNDGNIDLVTSIYYHRLQMYQNGGDPGDRSEVLLGDGKGHFTLKMDAGVHNVSMNDTLPLGLINATGMAYVDYDYDGILDLYISTWWTDYAANMAMPDLFLKGNGDGSFSRKTNIGLQGMTDAEYGINATDYDNDGWQDIITSPYCRTGGHLFKNLRNGKYADYTDFSNYSAQKMTGDHGQNLCQWSCQPADVDNDGDIDLLQVQVHGGYNENEGRTHLSTNSGYGGGYRFNWELNKIVRDAPIESHLGDQGGNFWDIDNDGWLDVAIGQSSYPAANLEGQERLYICRQDTDHILKDISKAVGVFNIKEGHTPIPGDYDLDGDVDLFISHTIRDTSKIQDSTVIKVWTQIELLQNNVGNEISNWIGVKLNPVSDSGINKSAIGARIYLSSKGLNQIREIQTGQGHFAGQMPFIQNFGIGSNGYADSVTIRWPHKDLLTTTIKYPPLNVISEIDNLGNLKVVKTWEGKRAIIAFDPPFLDFDTVIVGAEKTMIIKIRNYGDTILKINNLQYINNNVLSLVSASFPIEIQPDGSADVTFKFKPLKRGNSGDLIEASGNQSNRIMYFPIYADGYEDAPSILADSGQLNFGKVFVDSLKTMNMTLNNNGELPLIISDIKFENNDKNVFSFDMPTLPLTLQPKEKYILNVRFLPAEEVDYLSRISIASNAFNDSLMEIALWGSGDIPRPQITVSPTTMFMGTWGTNEFNEKDFNIENSGNGDLKVSQISVLDETMNNVYTLPKTTLPFTVRPSEQLAVTVRFSPKEDKVYNTKLVIKSNAIDEPEKQISLRGTGKPASVKELSEGSLNLKLGISPNPLSDEASIFVNSENPISNLSLYLTDLYGRRVKMLYQSVTFAGNYQTVLNTSDISSGTYYLTAQTESKFLVIPILIVK